MSRPDNIQKTAASPWLVLAGTVMPTLAFLIYIRWLLGLHPHVGIFDYYQVYYKAASEGGLPWINFNFEYPPLSLPFIFGPVLFFKGLTVLQVSVARGVWSFLVTVFSIFVFGRYETSTRRIPWATFGCGFCILVANKLYYMVYDWMPLCVLLAAATLPGSDNRSRLARNALLVVGLFTKLVPGVIYPFLRQGADGVSAIRRHALLLIFVAFHAVYAAINIPGTLWAIRYHTQRPIDGYSIYGTIALLSGRLGLSDDQGVFLNSTEAVVGTMSELLKVLSTVLFLAISAYIVVLYRKALRGPADSNEIAGWSAGISILMAFTIFGKLGQPNYCFWVAGCAAIMGVLFDLTRRQQVLIFTSSALFCALCVYQARHAPNLIHADVPFKVLIAGFAKFGLGLPIIGTSIGVLRRLTTGEVPTHPAAQLAPQEA